MDTEVSDHAGGDLLNILACSEGRQLETGGSLATQDEMLLFFKQGTASILNHCFVTFATKSKVNVKCQNCAVLSV